MAVGSLASRTWADPTVLAFVSRERAVRFHQRLTSQNLSWVAFSLRSVGGRCQPPGTGGLLTR